MKVKLEYNKLEYRWEGFRCSFKEDCRSSWMIINADEELIGHIERLRCGQFMHWCVTLEDGCYLSPGCNDEVREMQRKCYSLFTGSGKQ